MGSEEDRLPVKGNRQVDRENKQVGRINKLLREEGNAGRSKGPIIWTLLAGWRGSDYSPILHMQPEH